MRKAAYSAPRKINRVAEYSLDDNCKYCDDKKAQFLCKTCPGSLCEMCKAQHEAQHLSNPHEIIDMTSDKGGSLELLHCPSHKEKRLQFYCNREACLEEVCPDCVIEKHNGHKVEKLGEVYNQIRAKLQKESNEIDTELLPKYEKLLRKEDAKISRVSKRIDEVQKQMEAHANKIVGKVTAIKEKRVQDLQKEKEKALKSIEATKNTLEKNIEQLRGIKTQLDQKIDARPCTAFLNAGKNKRLTEMEEFPKDIEYTLDNFRAGDIETIVQENHFGTSPQITQTIQPENLKNVKEIIPPGRKYRVHPRFRKEEYTQNVF